MSDVAGPDLPEALRLAIGRDLRPVRPLSPPWRRSLALAPAAIATLVALPSYWGWREHFDTMSPLLTLGLSIAQVLVGLAVLAAALREGVPGRSLSSRAIVATVLAAVVVTVTITLVTDRALPRGVPPGHFLRWTWECWFVSVASALPLFALACWLMARTLPSRPALAGALGGLGVGVAGDAALRLFCGVTSPAHVLVSHGGAVVSLALLGAVTAKAIDAWTTRARRR